MANAGANVVVHARTSREEIEGVADEIRTSGHRAIAVLGDVTREEDVRAIFTAAEQAFQGVDILINNAAVRGQRDFLEMRHDEWRTINSVILDGAFLCSREALRSMITRGGGTIAGLSWLTGIDLATAAFASSAGGVVEMALTAQILQLNVAMVLGFHVVRAIMVNGVSIFIFNLLNRVGFFSAIERIEMGLLGARPKN